MNQARPPLHRAPDFIGIGAQKAGTSWLYTCLAEHPELWFPTKEVHFFSRERNWERGYEWYEELFGPAPAERMCGEFSTSYLADPFCPARIAKRYPKVKLICSLRNPIDRAISNYRNDLRAGRVPAGTSFGAALQDHPEYLDQGAYAIHLARFLEYFPRANLLILIYEDALSDPLQFIRTVYQFLGVEDGFDPPSLRLKVNESSLPRSVWLGRALQRLSEVGHTPLFRGAWLRLRGLPFARLIRDLNRVPSQPSARFSVERADLSARFADGIASLELLLQRDLSAWRA